MTQQKSSRPRVGIPYRSTKEELNGDRRKFEQYLEAVRRAGTEAVEISLGLTRDELSEQAQSLDALVLPGSSADVEPSRFGVERHAKSAEADPERERTDSTLLEYALRARQPVLAICYGVQMLNVHLGGTLVQDIPSELHSSIQHAWTGREQGAPEPFHEARIEPGTRLAQLAGASEVRVNSSHHQSIARPGKNLRVAARAPDGVIEAVEWTGDANWVTGVQWHPERMPDESLSQTLFRELVAAARKRKQVLETRG